MGWSIGFGIGPLRYRTSLGGRKRKKRTGKPYHYGQLKVNGKVIWKCEHHHQTESAAIQCSERERRRRGMPPAQAAPVKDWHQPPVEGLSPLRQPTTGQALKAAAANHRAKRAAESASTSGRAPVTADLSRASTLCLLPCHGSTAKRGPEHSSNGSCLGLTGTVAGHRDACSSDRPAGTGNPAW